MPLNLKNDLQIARLAADLRLRHDGDPVAAVLAYCNRKVHAIFNEFRSATLTDLLTATAARLDTLFIEIHGDADIERLRREHLTEEELVSGRLDHDLTPDVYAITYQRRQPAAGDRRFVSVIDCRGEKAARVYFSKWHELAHLLTLTPQGRLTFRRTHAERNAKDPEEALMDLIAGDVGFFRRLVRAHANGPVSFEKISALRQRLCPEASQEASMRGFVKAWPTPCLLVQARLGLKARDAPDNPQQRLAFDEGPAPTLRAVQVTANDGADALGLFIPRNMRIPERSTIARVLDCEEDAAALEAEEDLAWWVSSGGSRLDPRPVLVKARRRWELAEALILPLGPNSS